MNCVIDPLSFAALCWPHVTFYDKQREVIYSVSQNDETLVPAGNMLGKDFVTAFIVLWFFLSRHPCRIVTTSADYQQLENVLWGEIRRFIQESKHPLPLQVNHLHLKKIFNGTTDGLSYVVGRVAAKGEGMLGHHIAKIGDGVPRTMFVADEGSGVEDVANDRADTWADRKLVIGNTYECSNFFKRGVIAGDMLSPDKKRYYRKVIRIRATDSPNVRYALAQKKKGIEPTGEMLVPGVLSWSDYQKRRATWDPVKQSISLDAEFYEGSDTMLFPSQWLNYCEALYRERGCPKEAVAIGVDPAEGGDNTCWAVVGRWGLIALISKKTPNTNVVYAETLALMHRYNVRAEFVAFDSGGGGKQHADRMRASGHNVRAIAFGEAATGANRLRYRTLAERREEIEVRHIYKNRRAEMYGILRELINPEHGFSIPPQYAELRRQLQPIPLIYDGEGRLELPPKHKRDKDSTRLTMHDLIGCSPDEADALVLAVFAMTRKASRRKVGVYS